MIATTAGDLGDVVAMLCVVQSVPGPHTILLRDDGRTKGIVRRKDLIIPLVETQGVKCRPYQKGDTVDWESEKFRNGHHRVDGTLVSAHATHALESGVIPRLPDQREPWLTADPSPKTKGRVIVARSARYNNNRFPWGEVLKYLGDRALFVGLKHERDMLQNATGCKVEYQPTKDLLEVAQLIAGADWFIGNQSSPMVIAEALKHPRIQETCLHVPDCVYPPDGKNQYSADGSVEFEDFNHVFHGYDVKSIDYREVPHGGWVVKYNGITESQATPEKTARHLAKRAGIDYSLALREILTQTLNRQPRFFSRLIDTTQYRRAAQAHRNARWPEDHPLIRLADGEANFYVS